MRQLLLNGRFLTRAPTGVDRVAMELVRALQAIAQEDGKPAFRLDVAVPSTGLGDDEIRARLGLGADSRILRSRWSGYAWEQLWLGWISPRATLLSLANIGPLLRRNQLVLVHDAQIFDQPESYSKAFRRAYHLIIPRLARNAAWLATVSQHSRRRLNAHGIGAGRQIDVIPNGIDHLSGVASDPEILTRLGLVPRGYHLAVGSLARHKNIAMLAAAVSRRADQSIPLVMAGDFDSQVFGPSGVSAIQSTRLIGRVSDGELKALYENARLFLFPSLTEGFGLPPLEAMACGCPVLASTGGAIPEVCGEAAAYCDPQDLAAWTHAIEDLQSDDLRLADLARRGHAQAAGFTWAASARKLLEVLGIS